VRFSLCIYPLILGILVLPISVHAEEEIPSLLNESLRATYQACIGIDEALYDLKKMAGINTAVTGVGTGLGAGALAVGIVKYSKDVQAESYEKLLDELREMTKNANAQTLSKDDIAKFESEFNLSYDSAVKDLQNYENELNKLNTQSKKLGNWRTGLLAGNAVTNVAGAVISGTNRVDADLQGQIDNCKDSLKKLSVSIMQAKINGEDVSEAQNIYNTCREYDFVDISKINKRAKGATISSIVGATTGISGTVTSYMANTDETRNDNTDAGKKKEKNLNLASNILAGASTAASATATVFNASQIKAIKDVASVAAKCSEVLR